MHFSLPFSLFCFSTCTYLFLISIYFFRFAIYGFLWDNKTAKNINKSLSTSEEGSAQAHKITIIKKRRKNEEKEKNEFCVVRKKAKRSDWLCTLTFTLHVHLIDVACVLLYLVFSFTIVVIWRKMQKHVHKFTAMFKWGRKRWKLMHLAKSNERNCWCIVNVINKKKCIISLGGLRWIKSEICKKKGHASLSTTSTYVCYQIKVNW